MHKNAVIKKLQFSVIIWSPVQTANKWQ